MAGVSMKTVSRVVNNEPNVRPATREKVEAAITENTQAILATHVYGNPCDVYELQKIADKHNIKLIYDAAHAFGASVDDKSLLSFGDISTCSFHATKLFHTGEGGALFAKDKTLQHQLFYSHNFGHDGPLAFHGLGINGKISELQAAMGLAVLPHMETILAERKRVVDFYNKNLDVTKVQILKIRENTQWNFSYYPIIWTLFPKKFFFFRPSLLSVFFFVFRFQGLMDIGPGKGGEDKGLNSAGK